MQQRAAGESGTAAIEYTLTAALFAFALLLSISSMRQSLFSVSLEQTQYALGESPQPPPLNPQDHTPTIQGGGTETFQP